MRQLCSQANNAAYIIGYSCVKVNDTQRSASAAVDENYRFQNYSVIIAQVHRTYEARANNMQSQCTNDPSV